MEVRTGKTLTALEVCKLYGAKKVLFLTKKKAIKSIQKDYTEFNYSSFFDIEITNDEDMHNCKGTYDLVVHDEHHRFGAFPKASKRLKDYKLRFGNLPQIWLSGTPTPESYSQWFHQFHASNYTPFKGGFYAWAKRFVRVEKKKINGFEVNDYKDANNEIIMPYIKDYLIFFTQKEAGFSSEIEENILYCDMAESTNVIFKKLAKDRIVLGKSGLSIVADTPAKLLQKLHQISSGTIKIDDDYLILDLSKAEFIKKQFEGKKIALFYNFVGELEVLKKVFDNLTTDIETFNKEPNTNIALQIVSGREGVNLSKADALVFYNISHSATSYWQARDRLTTIDRLNNKIYFVFNRKGIEKRIFNAVLDKKNYTTSLFLKDLKDL